MHRNARSVHGDEVPGHHETARARDSSSPAVDLVHLGRFTLGNRALELEVLAIFESQIGSYIARLDDAENQKSWREAAHTIKGAAWAIGAWRLGKIAEDAERLSTEGPPEHRLAAIEDLAAAAADVLRFITDCLARERAVSQGAAVGDEPKHPSPTRANDAA